MLLREADFKMQIMQDQLDELIELDALVLEDSILACEAEMQSYLRSRYDVALIFATIPDYNPATTYAIGQSVWHLDQIYISIAQTIGNLPTNTTFWQRKDTRNALIVLYAVDIALYHLHARISLNNTPELRRIRYEAAIMWLKAVNSGKISVDLPVIVPETLPNNFRVISQDREQWLY